MINLYCEANEKIVGSSGIWTRTVRDTGPTDALPFELLAQWKMTSKFNHFKCTTNCSDQLFAHISARILQYFESCENVQIPLRPTIFPLASQYKFIMFTLYMLPWGCWGWFKSDIYLMLFTNLVQDDRFLFILWREMQSTTAPSRLISAVALNASMWHIKFDV